MDISQNIANSLKLQPQQVAAAIKLLDEGATVPFIARYRKEVTGGLSDTDLRQLQERLLYTRELEARRQTILKSIEEQGKLTPELSQAIVSTESKAELEDLYLPFKPKRRTKAMIAKEAGLEPLAQQLLTELQIAPFVLAEKFLNAEHQIDTPAKALEGARHILMETFTEQADLLGELREHVWQQAILVSKVVEGKQTAGSKFHDYFDYQEAIQNIPSHRALALLRGQREEFLRLQLTLSDEQIEWCAQKIAQRFNIHPKLAAIDWLTETINWTWRIKLMLKIELELMTRMREAAEETAIQVFANNLKNLLMTSPAGARCTMGLDPGFRTGVKVAVIDATGKLLAYTAIFPHQPQNQWQASIATLAKLCQQHQVELISIGNGTASRETDKLVNDLKKMHPELKLTSIMISEAGASVYSASELAAKEFPDLDVSYRGAVSIARRLQDPLAELVKIEPKSIGVGQYQHDVNQVKLNRNLHAVMEDCVNAVGVDLNTASVPLLACVAGLNESIAKNILQLRDEKGGFKNRLELKKVPRLGEKAFEQAAGFLRIVNGDNPLDASGVHPEAYPIVESILQKQQKSIKDLMGNLKNLQLINPKEYVNDQFGLPTVTDILKELEKPGRDPRPAFKTASFQEGIEKISDLKSGLILEGVVTNVANFGAFVDIGVHQDGLVHISMLANHFVKDPNTVVKVGDIVKVKVIEIDLHRNRIQLSMRMEDAATTQSSPKVKHVKTKPMATPKMESALGAAFREALTEKK